MRHGFQEFREFCKKGCGFLRGAAPRQAAVVSAGVSLGVLLLAGALARSIEEPLWRELRARRPALELAGVKDALGQGVTAALLGGFSAVLADFTWLRANALWEDNNLPATQASIKLTTAIDPRPLYFWINGARMIAYDMPFWRIMEEGGHDKVPEARQRRIDEEQSAVALAYLKDGLRTHPGSPALLLEAGNIHLNRLKDTAAAADYYGRAAEQPGAPYYAARLHAVLLVRLGRVAEALESLKRVYPTLPKPGDKRATAFQVESAMAGTVLGRIRELEERLKVPEGERVGE
ncbi:MAG: hypothetical protein LBR12_03915 [Opitutaceae bacterium]|jgi:tetratricopeptide (TPR) repeat protein|nr:hypothetical protein [Opitutaceae bacterium]